MARTVAGNVHSLLWKSFPINSNAGYKAEFIDVSMGMGQDVVLCMCLVLQEGRTRESKSRRVLLLSPFLKRHSLSISRLF